MTQPFRAISFLVLCVAGMLLSSCNGNITEIILVVHTDLKLDEEVDTIGLEFMGPSGNSQRQIPVGTGAEKSLPLVITLFPEDGVPEDSNFAIVVEAKLGSSTVRRRTVETSFVPNESKVLVVTLRSACDACDGDETCNENGRCDTGSRPGADLPPFDGTIPGIPGLQCVPSPEVCNGLDDNCDGQIDESTGDICGSGQPNTVSAACERGQCIANCEANFANCDFDITNGCEVSLMTDDNCRACGHECGGACGGDVARPLCGATGWALSIPGGSVISAISPFNKQVLIGGAMGADDEIAPASAGAGSISGLDGGGAGKLPFIALTSVATGNIIAGRRFEGVELAAPENSIVDIRSDGTSIFVLGQYQSINLGGAPLSATGTGIFLASFSLEGNSLALNWERTIDSSSDDTPTALEIIDGTLLMIGEVGAETTARSESPPYLIPPGAFFLGYSTSTGNILHGIAFSKDPGIASVDAIASDGADIFVAGTFDGAFEGGSVSGKGSFTTKTTLSGDDVWTWVGISESVRVRSLAFERSINRVHTLFDFSDSWTLGNTRLTATTERYAVAGTDVVSGSDSWIFPAADGSGTVGSDMAVYGQQVGVFGSTTSSGSRDFGILNFLDAETNSSNTMFSSSQDVSFTAVGSISTGFCAAGTFTGSFSPLESSVQLGPTQILSGQEPGDAFVFCFDPFLLD